MTDEVGGLVLRDNYEQNVALATARAAGAAAAARPRGLDAAARAARACSTASWSSCRAARRSPTRLERRRGADRARARGAAGLHQDRAGRRALDTDLPDDPFLRRRPARVLPARRCGETYARADGGTTRCAARSSSPRSVNDLVNGAGITFFHRLSEETGAIGGGAGPGELRGPGDLRLARASSTTSTPTTTGSTPRRRCGCGIEMRTLVERASRWLVNNRRPPIDSEATVDFFGVIAPSRWCRRCRSCSPAASWRRSSSATRRAGRRRASPRSWPSGSRCCRRRTPCSRSSRPPSATRSTRSRSAGVHFALGERLGLSDAGRPDPRAAARRPLADDGAGGAARRPARGARAADRAGARRHRPADAAGAGADRGLGGARRGRGRRARSARSRRSAPTSRPTWPGCRSGCAWCARCSLTP